MPYILVFKGIFGLWKQLMGQLKAPLARRLQIVESQQRDLLCVKMRLARRPLMFVRRMVALPLAIRHCQIVFDTSEASFLRGWPNRTAATAFFLDTHEIRKALILAQFLDAIDDQRCPAGLMTGTEPLACLAMKILVEQDEVLSVKAVWAVLMIP